MADFTFITTSSVDSIDDAKVFKPTTNSNISPTFDSVIDRLDSPFISEEIPLVNFGLNSSISAVPAKGRPAGGQLYPRGVYNK